MGEKMNFSIDHYTVLEDNPFMSLLRAFIVCDGSNPNQTFFTKEVIERAKPTLFNIPIFAILDESGDFKEHVQTESDDKNKNAIGMIPESCNCSFEEYEGRTYLVANICIWKAYFPVESAILKSKDKFSKISMEILVTNSHERDNDELEIDDFIFTSIFLLGDKYGTGIPNAHMEMIRYSSKEYEALIKETNKQLQLFSIPQEVKDNAKQALELPQTNPQLIQFAKDILDSDGFNYSKITMLFGKINNLRKEDNILFYGGSEGREWYKNIIMQFESEKEVDVVYEEVTQKFSLNSCQIEEILSNALSEFKYKDGDYEWNRYWVKGFDEEFVYVHDNEDSKDKRMKYNIQENVAIIDVESAEEVISAGFMPVVPKSEESEIETEEFVEGEKPKGEETETFSQEEHMKMKADFEELSGKYKELEEKFTAMEEDYAKLNTFKVEQIKKDEEMMMTSSLNEYSKILSEEDKKEFTDKIKEYSFETFEKELTAKVAKIALFAINNPPANQETNSNEGVKVNYSALLLNLNSEDVESSTLADKLEKTYK